ncbi:MAG: hypothetical protein WBF53_12150, partial [Litorimonas sp.]
AETGPARSDVPAEARDRTHTGAASPTPIRTAPPSPDRPRLEDEPFATELTCSQNCDAQAQTLLNLCRRTVAAVRSEPNWMGEDLGLDDCGRAAVAGADQCRTRCPNAEAVASR